MEIKQTEMERLRAATLKAGDAYHEASIAYYSARDAYIKANEDWLEELKKHD